MKTWRWLGEIKSRRAKSTDNEAGVWERLCASLSLALIELYKKKKNPAQSIYQHHQSLIHYELTQQLMSMKTRNLKTLIFLKNKEVIIER